MSMLSRPFQTGDKVYLKPGKETKGIVADERGTVVQRKPNGSVQVDFEFSDRQWVKAHRIRLQRKRKFQAGDYVEIKNGRTGHPAYGTVTGRGPNKEVLVEVEGSIPLAAKDLRLTD